MEEEENEDKGAGVLNGKCPSGGKHINFNAPLLSTRRRGSSRRTNNSCSCPMDMNTSERIPFSWEQTPGKPKLNHLIIDIDVVTTKSSSDHYMMSFLPPRPPPAAPRLHLTKTAAEDVDWDWEYYSSCNNVDHDHDHVGGCDVDADDDRVSSNNYNDNNIAVLDIFSLAQSTSLGTNESRDTGDGRSASSMEEEEEKERDLDDVDEAGSVKMASPSTNFLMQRFLPDAKALAASALITNTIIYDDDDDDGHHHHDHYNYSCTTSATTTTSRAVSLRQSSPFSSSKGGCGLHNFLPWRAKLNSSSRPGGGVKTPPVGSRTWQYRPLLNFHGPGKSTCSK